MYSSNHSVRHCSILNLHIIITQIVLPNQSKHMDMILRELWGYYAGLLAHTRTPTHAHMHTFPRLNKCQIQISSQQEITSRSWGRSFLRAGDPLHIPPACIGSCISTAHARTWARAHTRTCQLYSNMPAVPYKGARQLHIVSGLHSVSEFASTGSHGQWGFSRKFVKP